MPTEALPTVFAYLDYRRYLADWFAAKKANNPRYSYRVFARAAGQKSSGLLLAVASGKRNLTASTTVAFCTAMKLKAAESRFFAQLVDLEQASTADERNEAWEQISATKRFREARKLEGSGFDYLSHWYYPAIRELAHRPDFEADPAWIARTLQPRITPSQAKGALKALLDLGLVVKQKDGRVVPTETSVVTAHEVFGLAVYNYHRGMMTRAQGALDDVPPAERHFGAVTVAVPVPLVARLKEEIGAFQERLLAMCDGADGDAEQVYQLNLQLFPLSTRPQETS